MIGKYIESFSLVLLMGFFCVFMMPELVALFAYRLPGWRRIKNSKLPVDKSLGQFMLESLFWVIALAAILIIAYFLYGLTPGRLLMRPSAIGCLLVGGLMSAYHVLDLYSMEKRAKLIAAIEQRHKMPLGQILLKAGIISPHQLHAALSSQAKENLPLGQVLVKKRIVDPQTLNKYLKKQQDLKAAFQAEPQAGKRVPLIGELMLEAGIITQQQLDIVLAQQQVYGGTIGELLISNRCVDEDELALALYIQNAFDSHEIPDDMAQRVIQASLENMTENLGTLLANCGLITRNQRDIALAEHEATGRRMGDILVEHLYCSRDLVETVANIQRLGRATTSTERAQSRLTMLRGGAG